MIYSSHILVGLLMLGLIAWSCHDCSQESSELQPGVPVRALAGRPQQWDQLRLTHLFSNQDSVKFWFGTLLHNNTCLCCNRFCISHGLALCFLFLKLFLGTDAGLQVFFVVIPPKKFWSIPCNYKKKGQKFSRHCLCYSSQANSTILHSSLQVNHLLLVVLFANWLVQPQRRRAEHPVI